MRALTWITTSLALGACLTAAAAEPLLTEPPGPLPTRDLVIPEIQERTLSNGLRVAVVENHEIPLVWMRLVFGAGAWSDPAGQEGLAAVAMDMLDEGAGDRDALALSGALQAMASELGTGAGLDSAWVTASALTRNLEPTVALMADVLLRPTLDDTEWERLRERLLVELREQEQQPRALCYRALDRVMYGDAYDGRHVTEESYAAITTDGMRAWLDRHVHPGNALLLVGGDTTPERIVPLLEAQLGGWQAGEAVTAPAPQGLQPTRTVIHLMDKPGAPQSVIGVGRFVAQRTEDDYYDLVLADTALGGIFTSRINLNLREDKGWTYGARSTLYTTHAPTQWMVVTSVAADATAPAVGELVGELRAVAGERPLTPDELEFARSNRIHAYPAKFEQTGYLLGELARVWLYGLPDDWLDGHLERLRAVSVFDANAAAALHLVPDALAVVVVGDAASVREPLEALGIPVVAIDRRGALLEPLPPLPDEAAAGDGADGTEADPADD